VSGSGGEGENFKPSGHTSAGLNFFAVMAAHAARSEVGSVGFVYFRLDIRRGAVYWLKDEEFDKAGTVCALSDSILGSDRLGG
jgi:hypothetical protein